MELHRPLTIETMEGGAILERLEHELKEVLVDCCDINKVADSVREIALKIKIKPDAQRITLDIGFETSNKLGKRHPVLLRAFLDDETQTASELTAKEGSLPFPKDEQGKMTVIGGNKQ